MADVINLNRFRKKKARAERARQADTNRRKHGRTPTEKEAERKQRAQFERTVDGAKLDKTSETERPEKEESSDDQASLAPSDPDGQSD